MCQTNLSTGEFARLCGTTKATLFHYEKLGLLRPKHVSGNGYRRYGIEQFFDFEMIAILKETGSSLDEIMRMRADLDEDGMAAVLEEKRHALRMERERLESRERMLENILADLREAGGLALDEFAVRELDEEFLETAPAGGGNHENLAESIIRYAAYMSSRNGNAPALCSTFGVILDEAVLTGAAYHELLYFNRSSPDAGGNLHKRAGKYLVAGHRGDFASHLECLKKMGEWCSANKLRVCGRVYAYDLASFLRPQSAENYIIKYAVPVVPLEERFCPCSRGKADAR